MIDSKRLKYDDVLSHNNEIIAYAIKASSAFSLITEQKKPYSVRPAVCKNADYLSLLQPYLISQDVGVTRWPGTISRETHKVLNLYRSCSKSRDILCGGKNIFEYSSEVPEDICFYKDKNPWLVTVSHEKLAWLWQPDSKDSLFFKEWFNCKTDF